MEVFCSVSCVETFKLSPGIRITALHLPAGAGGGQPGPGRPEDEADHQPPESQSELCQLSIRHLTIDVSEGLC